MKIPLVRSLFETFPLSKSLKFATLWVTLDALAFQQHSSDFLNIFCHEKEFFFHLSLAGRTDEYENSMEMGESDKYAWVTLKEKL